MEAKSKYSTGIQYGIIIALMYTILLFIRYNVFGKSPVSFGLFAVCSYLIILGLYLLPAFARRKELGGFATFKEIFQTIFIAILITEIVYVLFNFVYLKFIDPSFFDNLKVATRTLLEKANTPEEQIDKQMQGFKDVNEQLKPLKLLQGLGMWIVIDSIFGLIFASIIKKNKDVFDDKQSPR
ncbi:MAG TPA: DUF4199 domain-containing protein [Puia sp.]|nr:DUF4199 domain-containing protein [Puia sp.]